MFESSRISGQPLYPAMVAAYKQAWSELGALTGAPNYYRASNLHPSGPGQPGVTAMTLHPRQTIVRPPTQII